MNNNFGQAGFGNSKAVYQVNKFPQYTNTFYGSSASVAVSASLYYLRGWQVEVESGNPWTMTATLNCEVGGDGITPITGSGTYITINWSYHYKTTEKEILHVNTDVISWINNINQQDKIRLDYLVANPPKDGVVDWTTFTTSSVSVSASVVLWNMLQSGTRTVPVITPILRQTLVVPSTYNMGSFNTNLYNVYTKGTLSSAIGIPTNWYNIMPQGTDPSSTATNNIPYHYGWLKNPPTQDQNGTVITIQQDYEYGLYPQNIYGTAL